MPLPSVRCCRPLRNSAPGRLTIPSGDPVPATDPIRPGDPRRQPPPVGSSDTFTTSLPKFSPLSSPRNAPTALSIPSTTSSR